MTNFQLKLKTSVDILLSNNSTWQERRSSVFELHTLFTALGAENSIEEPLDLADHLPLPSGRAIAPRQAGLCLLEVRRTRVFLQALVQAISDLLRQFPHKTITVLDAGCGPYALLALLAAPYFTPQQVQFTVLDIHQANLDSAQTLVHALGLNGYFKGFVQADATTWQWPGSEGPDIVISETMNRGLQKEPQVAITLHLTAQMPPHGILIPEAVVVSLCTTNVKLMAKLLNTTAEDTVLQAAVANDLGTVLTLDRYSTRATITRRPLKTVSIPAEYDEALNNLVLLTAITAYKQHRLEWFNCSLTLPLHLQPYGKKTVKAGDTLQFHYALTDWPGIEFVQCCE